MTRNRNLLLGAVSAAALMLAACQPREGPAERAGKQIDNAAEKVGQQADKAADSVKDAARDTKKAAQDAAN